MLETDPNTVATSWHIRLRRVLVQYFSEEELQTLCYDLRVDYEDLPGESKTQKAISLIINLTRQGRVDQLIDLCSQERPNVPWEDLRTAATQNPQLVEEAPDKPGQSAAQPEPAAAARLPMSLTTIALGGVALVLALVMGLVIWNGRDTSRQVEATPLPAASTTAVEATAVPASPTATAVAATTLLLSEDFESGQAANWQNSNPAVTLSVVTLPDGNHALLLKHGVEALYTPAWEWNSPNYRLEADVMVSDLTPDTSIGWNARIPNPTASGYCQGYRAEIGPVHTALHIITAAGCFSAWQYENLDYGPFSLEADTWHRLSLDVTGNQLRLFVDDLLTLVATDNQNTFANGGIGLIVFLSEEAYVDNVKVTAFASNP